MLKFRKKLIRMIDRNKKEKEFSDNFEDFDDFIEEFEAK